MKRKQQPTTPVDESKKLIRPDSTEIAKTVLALIKEPPSKTNQKTLKCYIEKNPTIFNGQFWLDEKKSTETYLWPEIAFKSNNIPAMLIFAEHLAKPGSTPLLFNVLALRQLLVVLVKETKDQSTMNELAIHLESATDTFIQNASFSALRGFFMKSIEIEAVDIIDRLDKLDKLPDLLDKPIPIPTHENRFKAIEFAALIARRHTLQYLLDYKSKQLSTLSSQEINSYQKHLFGISFNLQKLIKVRQDEKKNKETTVIIDILQKAHKDSILLNSLNQMDPISKPTFFSYNNQTTEFKFFELNEAPGDGDCFFHAAGTTRKGFSEILITNFSRLRPFIVHDLWVLLNDYMCVDDLSRYPSVNRLFNKIQGRPLASDNAIISLYSIIIQSEIDVHKRRELFEAKVTDAMLIDYSRSYSYGESGKLWPSYELVRDLCLERMLRLNLLMHQTGRRCVIIAYEAKDPLATSVVYSASEQHFNRLLSIPINLQSLNSLRRQSTSTQDAELLMNIHLGATTSFQDEKTSSRSTPSTKAITAIRVKRCSIASVDEKSIAPLKTAIKLRMPDLKPAAVDIITKNIITLAKTTVIPTPAAFFVMLTYATILLSYMTLTTATSGKASSSESQSVAADSSSSRASSSEEKTTTSLTSAAGVNNLSVFSATPPPSSTQTAHTSTTSTTSSSSTPSRST